MIQLRRNFGQTAALAAGFDFASGRMLVTIDADLQNDPADIPSLLAELRAGCDVVSCWRQKRQDSWWTRILPSKIANALISRMRVGPRFVAPGRPIVTRFQVTCWVLGVLTTWLASDWRVHVVAERMNYSVHMIQHLLFAMVAAPLLLLGTPPWLARWVLRPGSHVFRIVRSLSRFLPALVVFNLVLVLTH